MEDVYWSMQNNATRRELKNEIDRDAMRSRDQEIDRRLPAVAYYLARIFGRIVVGGGRTGYLA